MKKDDNKNINEIKNIEWGGWLNEFLWICAGANRHLLRQCPTDYAKYAGIGGTILFTALMASLSGGYALNTVFHNNIVAVSFGIFWGLLIFNLDRFIVNTMYSDGKTTISWGEISGGLPRIIIAIFLGIVISTPLELKIFEDEISITISELKKSKANDYIAADQQKIDSLSQKKEEVLNTPPGQSIYSSGITTANIETNNLFNEIKNKTAELNQHKDVIAQINAQLNRLDKNASNYDQRRNALRNKLSPHIVKRNNLSNEINQLNGQLSASDKTIKGLLTKDVDQKEQEGKRLQKEIDAISLKMNNADKTYQDDLNKKFGGFQAHLSAFNKMKEDNSSTNLASLFIMLLFIIIETAPTFFKMMIESGPYDDLLRSEMHKARVLSEKRISDINDEINTAIQISTEKNKNKLEAEVLANRELLNKIATTQAELLHSAIEEWRKQELEKIKSNPSHYIHSEPAQNQKLVN